LESLAIADGVDLKNWASAPGCDISYATYARSIFLRTQSLQNDYKQGGLRTGYHYPPQAGQYSLSSRTKSSVNFHFS